MPHTMERVAVIAITRNGINIAKRLAGIYPGWDVHAPAKLSDGDPAIKWYDGPTPEKVGSLFGSNDALVCLFSLGAVIRLIAPRLRDKKTDPAVLVVDDAADHVISALSGHIGGANALAREIAERLGARPVITTAADVNKTIAVDLVGRDLGWRIEDGSNVTATSAHMVNGEPVGVFQDAGARDWCAKLPANVTVYGSIGELEGSASRGCLIISDGAVPGGLAARSVIYRPPSLVAGVGIHRDTKASKVLECLGRCLEEHGLSQMSVARLASIKKPQEVPGLAEAAARLGVPVEYVPREDLAGVRAPNPSETVRGFEGTASVSEAAAILVAGGELVVEKQKFPPDLTVAIARVPG